MSELLRATGMRIGFPVPGGIVHALSDVSLSVDSGEIVALVGESGSGKTTAALAIMGVHPLDSGTIRFMGQTLETMSPAKRREIGKHIQMVLQDPYGSLDPRWPVGRIVAEPLVSYGIGSRDDRRRRVKQLLDLVALPGSVAERFPRQLSGGQRQRVAIARALAVEPRLIVADEPVSALDVSVRAQILSLLRDIQAETGVALLVIAHDLAMVRAVADRVNVMYLGRVVESGSAASVIDEPTHPYTKALIAAVPEIELAQSAASLLAGEPASPLSPPSGCAFHPRCPHTFTPCRVDLPLLVAGEDGRSVACHLSSVRDADPGSANDR